MARHRFDPACHDIFMTPIPLTAAADESPSAPLITAISTVAAPTAAAAHRALEAQAEGEREKVVEEDATRTWHGLPLQPWSEERQRLLDRLTAADIPLPDTSTCDDITFYHGMFGWAVKALYLALHEPRDWEPLRPRLLAHIEAWSAAEHIPAGLDERELKAFVPERLNVPGDTLGEKAAAVNLVVTMVNAHRKIMALRRTMRRTRGTAAEGN